MATEVLHILPTCSQSFLTLKQQLLQSQFMAILLPKTSRCTECHEQSALIFHEAGLWFVLCHPHRFLSIVIEKQPSFQNSVESHLPSSSSSLFYLHSSSNLSILSPAKGFCTAGVSPLFSAFLQQVYLCHMTYLYLFICLFISPDFECSPLHKILSLSTIIHYSILWRECYQTCMLPDKLYFLGIDVVLFHFRDSAACKFLLHV